MPLDDGWNDISSVKTYISLEIFLLHYTSEKVFKHNALLNSVVKIFKSVKIIVSKKVDRFLK